MTAQTKTTDQERSLLRRIEAWAQEELGTRRRLLELLHAQESGLTAPYAGDLETVSKAVLELLQDEPRRAGQLAAMMDRLAACWHLDPLGMTLGGVATRAGSEGDRLRVLRNQLRATCEEILRCGRRIALIAQTQRTVVREALDLLMGASDQESSRSGALVDAEA